MRIDTPITGSPEPVFLWHIIKDHEVCGARKRIRDYIYFTKL